MGLLNIFKRKNNKKEEIEIENIDKKEAIEKVRRKIESKEEDIKNSLEEIKDIYEKVDFFDIEIFYDYSDLRLRLWSMDNNNCEVISEDKSVFSDSKYLCDEIDFEGEEANIDLSDEIFNMLKDIIRKYIGHIEIPIYLEFHHVQELYDLKNDCWK